MDKKSFPIYIKWILYNYINSGKLVSIKSLVSIVFSSLDQIGRTQATTF